MATIEVSPRDYEILASILKDGAGMRHHFTFKELLDTLKNIGFEEVKGRFRYSGKDLFVFKPGDKGRAPVSFARQDELKRQMDVVFGWTKGSFVEEAGVVAVPV